MNKFHQIPTDKFVPISHDNSYLFNHYDKVANFLAFNLEKNYKSILAKPVQNGYAFDWFSVYENLVNINEQNTAEAETALMKYWEFIEVINAKIQQLSNSNDENNKNWAKLLTKVFNRQDNFIFSNGKDICIVWGWKFDNNELYKPNIAKNQNLDLIPEKIVASIEKPLEKNVPEFNPTNISHDFIEEEDLIEEIVFEEVLIDEDINHKSSGFLEFLKWFASKYWWLLLILLGLIMLIAIFQLMTLTNKINNI
ncbi:hypothetical protein [Flavobacterium sp. ACAM 123]|jgi:hypothetical protein|uniref:hypothetical protein n=1 Tax=Flavobacterium sp. ACAM 123 TaxID=1189620 RepID=UPI0002EE5BAD|nr:hypothetical protein [Flavobacterium sp. ACAM 123]